MIKQLWAQFKVLSALPEGLKRNERWLGRIVYFLITALGIYMMYSITVWQPTHTDVNRVVKERVQTSQVLRDTVMCPFVPGTKYRRRLFGGRNPYQRIYTVEYGRAEVAKLNMTDQELDSLARFAQTGFLNNTDRFILLEKAKLLPDYSQFQIATKRFEKVISKIYGNLYRFDDPIGYLWMNVTMPGWFTRLSSYSEVCYPKTVDTDDPYWCITALEQLWMGNTLCLLFPFISRNQTGIQNPRGIKHPYYYAPFNSDIYKQNNTEGLGIKLWMGNLQTQVLNDEHMWPMYVWTANTGLAPSDCSSSVLYDSYLIKNVIELKRSVCQDLQLFKHNIRFNQTNCTELPLNSYWEYKIKMAGDCEAVLWSSVQAEYKMTTSSSMTFIQRVQTYGGICGFTNGISALGLLEFFMQFIKKGKAKKVIRVIQIFVLVTALGFSVYLAWLNMQQITSQSTRFSTVLSWEPLSSANSIAPVVVLAQEENVPMDMLNHSKLVAYNISKTLLSYMSVQSGAWIYDWDKYWYFYNKQKVGEIKPGDKAIVDSILMDVKGEQMKWRMRVNTTLFTQESLDRFEKIAVRMGYNRNFARYELFQGRWQCHSIVIRFPDIVQLSKKGEGNSLAVYFDPSIVKESNYAYGGAEHYSYIRKLGVRRANQGFSYFIVMLQDGNNPEQTDFNKQTRIYFDAFERRQMTKISYSTESNVRLHENKENICRSADVDCGALGNNAGNRLEHVLARYVSEKTMCGCSICAEHPQNPLIGKFWNITRCCSSRQIRDCMLTPITCCAMNRNRCCFNAKLKEDTVCDTSSFYYNSIITNRKQVFKNCQPGYEVFNEKAAKQNSIIAKKITDEDRMWFEERMTHCNRPLCSQKAISISSKFTILESSMTEDTNHLHGLQFSMASDNVLTSNEIDSFTPIEAFSQCLAGFGLLLGLSVLTMLELVVSFVSSVFQCATSADSDDEDAADDERVQRAAKGLRQIVISRLTRSISIFKSTVQATSNQVAPQQDEDGVIIHLNHNPPPLGSSHNDRSEAVEPSPPPEDASTTANTAGIKTSTIMLLFATISFVLIVYLSIEFILSSASRVNTVYSISLEGELQPPSVVLCTIKGDNEQLAKQIKYAKCTEDDHTSNCAEDFRQVANDEDGSCMIHDRTELRRQYSDVTRNVVDYAIELSENANLTFTVWVGHLREVVGGEFNPKHEWLPGKSMTVHYSLSEMSQDYSCEREEAQGVHCAQCAAVPELKHCCIGSELLDVMVVRNIYQDHAQRLCDYPVYSLTRIYTVNTGNTARYFKLVEPVGAVDRIKRMKHHNWTSIFSVLGGIMDMFLGLTLLNIVCTLITQLVRRIKVMLSVIVVQLEYVI